MKYRITWQTEEVIHHRAVVDAETMAELIGVTTDELAKMDADDMLDPPDMSIGERRLAGRRDLTDSLCDIEDSDTEHSNEFDRHSVKIKVIEEIELAAGAV